MHILNLILTLDLLVSMDAEDGTHPIKTCPNSNVITYIYVQLQIIICFGMQL